MERDSYECRGHRWRFEGRVGAVRVVAVVWGLWVVRVAGVESHRILFVTLVLYIIKRVGGLLGLAWKWLVRMRMNRVDVECMTLLRTLSSLSS